MPRILDLINNGSPQDAAKELEGLYEHSPWIVQRALEQRPFASAAHLKHAMVRVLAESPRQARLDLIRAHPELAGRAMVDATLTDASSAEQDSAGLTRCTVAEFEKLQQLNRDYNARFGFPFILAVRGPRGTGLSKSEIIATFERRLQGHPEFELQECLRNIHRIAEIRLNDKLGYSPERGNSVWDAQERLAQWSDDEASEPRQLTVTYLGTAHRACAERIRSDMLDCGCDEAEIDAVGNVVGRYYGNGTDPRSLLTGSHYDTVRNGGRYDGRLGIYVPLASVQQLRRHSMRLPFGLEIVAFAEEEGQRYRATFLGSSALTGDFNPAWLDQCDAQGISMRQAMQDAGLQIDSINSIRRDPANYLAFVEVHIEQGPVLTELDLPLGVVTSINASLRYTGEVTGMASHAGTTPMDRRRDAAAAVAELTLYVEQRASSEINSVGTVGILQVPQGSINVVPGRCEFSLDLRAPTDAQRDALADDVVRHLQLICRRRGVAYSLVESLRARAAPCASEWRERWERAVRSLGLPVHRLPSGAGHDAMKLHTIVPQAMLFVRGQNSGISHNPLESVTNDDMQLAVEAFDFLLQDLAQGLVR